MTLDDLRAFIAAHKDEDGDLEVGVEDHYGAFMPMRYGPEVKKIYDSSRNLKLYVVFDAVDIGEEPL